jgi:hypothetical protein
VIIDIQEVEFYWLCTKFGKLKTAFHKKTVYTAKKKKILSIEKIGREDVVFEKLSKSYLRLEAKDSESATVSKRFNKRALVHILSCTSKS